MSPLILPLLGFLAAGAGLVWVVRKVRKIGLMQLNEEQKCKEKILELARQKNHIATDQVQAFLGVSDIAAEIYLNLLVDEGRLIKEGEWDKYPVYKLKE